MMNGTFLLIGMGLLFFPRLFEWNNAPLRGLDYWASGGYLGKWIWFGFPLLTILLVIPLATFTQGSAIIFPAMAFLNGIFAVLTRVCPIPSNRVYSYVHDLRARRVGFFQFILSAICLIFYFRYFYELS